MKGRMFKVGILLDSDKIIKEGKYDIRDILYTIDEICKENNFKRDFDLIDGTMIYYGENGWGDVQGYGMIICKLEGAPWFMPYIKKFTSYENEQCDEDDEFYEGDILATKKRIDKLWRKAKWGF
jgi:hypothetical protein